MLSFFPVQIFVWESVTLFYIFIIFDILRWALLDYVIDWKQSDIISKAILPECYQDI